MSGGGQQESGGLPSWLQDRASGLIDYGTGLAQQPWQNYDGQRVANQSPLQQLAFGGMQNLAWGNPSMDAANNYLTSTINGQGGGNPYSSAVTDRVNTDVTDAFNRATAGTTQRFNNAGGWGSDRHLMADANNSQALARGLSEGTAGVYSNDYNTDQSRRMQASAAAPALWNSQIGGMNTILGAGNQQQGYEQSLLNSLYGDWQGNQNQGWDNFGRLSTLFGGNPTGAFGRTTPGPDPVSSGLGLAMVGNSLSKPGGKGGGSSK